MTLYGCCKIDASALHPELPRLKFKGRQSYWSDANSARKQLKAGLAATLGIEHDLYIVSNTSHGLLAVLAGVQAGRWTIHVEQQQHYGPYLPLLTAIGTGSSEWTARFVTHVEPTTGVVSSLRRGAESVLIVDAAQSFATSLHQHLLRNADIFIAPLHKHVGVVIGLALIGIRKDTAKLESFRQAAALAEHGAMSLELLLAACNRIQALDGRLLNKATINIPSEFSIHLGNRGINVLTPLNRSGFAGGRLV